MRADRLVVERGLATSVQDAARLILAGRILSGTMRIDKPGQLLMIDAALALHGYRRFVSRGGDKLLAALEGFRLDVRERVCLDAGCSTGGFTDCLLQHGAALVHAVDVGYGQLAWQLRTDVRVSVRERTNVRALEPGDLDPPPELIVADLAFIALRTVLPVFSRLLDQRAAAARLLVLVKPQFELERDAVGAGVVVDPALHARAVAVVAEAGSLLGFEVAGPVASPLVGPQGNREFFLLMTRMGAGA